MKSSSTARFLFFAVLALGTQSVFAQKTACAYLEPGAGYAAWMRVVSGNYASKWSSSFPIGTTRCQSLAELKDGQQFTVQISAVLGSSKVPCSPSLKRVSSSDATVTYHAWGTTLSVKCQMPDMNNASEEAIEPSKEGLKAKADLEAGKLPANPPKEDE